MQSQFCCIRKYSQVPRTRRLWGHHSAHYTFSASCIIPTSHHQSLLHGMSVPFWATLLNDLCSSLPRGNGAHVFLTLVATLTLLVFCFSFSSISCSISTYGPWSKGLWCTLFTDPFHPLPCQAMVISHSNIIQPISNMVVFNPNFLGPDEEHQERVRKEATRISKTIFFLSLLKPLISLELKCIR